MRHRAVPSSGAIWWLSAAFRLSAGSGPAPRWRLFRLCEVLQNQRPNLGAICGYARFARHFRCPSRGRPDVPSALACGYSKQRRFPQPQRALQTSHNRSLRPSQRRHFAKPRTTANRATPQMRSTALRRGRRGRLRSCASSRVRPSAPHPGAPARGASAFPPAFPPTGPRGRESPRRTAPRCGRPTRSGASRGQQGPRAAARR